MISRSWCSTAQLGRELLGRVLGVLLGWRLTCISLSCLQQGQGDPNKEVRRRLSPFYARQGTLAATPGPAARPQQRALMLTRYAASTVAGLCNSRFKMRVRHVLYACRLSVHVLSLVVVLSNICVLSHLVCAVLHSWDHSLRYLSLHNANYVRVFKGHRKAVVSMAMCPNNDHFASASLDGTGTVVPATSPPWPFRLTHFVFPIWQSVFGICG